MKIEVGHSSRSHKMQSILAHWHNHHQKSKFSLKYVRMPTHSHQELRLVENNRYQHGNY